VAGYDAHATSAWLRALRGAVAVAVWRAARTNAERETDVCVQEHAQSLAQGPHLEHGEA